ncbi:hypothetical protein BD779DRAFT_1669293 [Infundibulicybe gibba]|nr:hypothetical protein BD779DRAFT_1669293 [Infundibulicybe gibba]
MPRHSRDANTLNIPSDSSIEKALTLRQKNRIINSRKKHAEADRLRNETLITQNMHTRGMPWSRKQDTWMHYADMFKQQGCRAHPVLMSSLAAVHLKLERSDIAEWAATVALLYDPHMTRARYRRGVARRKQCDLGAAHADFETVLIEDPHHIKANQEMDDIQGHGMRVPGPLQGTALEKAVKPDFDDDPWELSSVDSDSTDCRHVGNGIPCRFYNSPNGCSRNEGCRFSHAPDDKSIRDRLGRNVCAHYLFNACRSGNTCNYSHSRTYLKPGQWDNLGNEDQLAEYEAARSQVAKIKKFTRKLCRIPPTKSPVPTIGIWKWPGKRAQVVIKVPSRTVSATNQNRFVLLLSFENEYDFARIYSRLLSALNSKIRVQQALRATAALPLLDSPDLAGVFVTDSGIARRLNKKVLIKLVDYANAGGNVVIGGFFSMFISSGEFDSFFNKAWSLPWTWGSYHRTAFSLNRTHKMVRRNPSLVAGYSMEAVHATNIRHGDAVYAPADYDQPITKLSKSPVTHTRVGKGYLGYIGDANAEDGSTNVVLAMLGLLDALEPIIRPTPFILVLSFDYIKYTNTYYSDLLSKMRSKMEVVHGLSSSRVMELISSPDLAGILIMDSPIDDVENTPLLKKVVEFTKRGGNVVLGGLFSGGLAPDEMNAFFANNWDLPWKMSNYTNTGMVVNAQHPLAKKGKGEGLTAKYHAKSVFLSDIKPEVAVYRAGPDSHICYSPSDPRAAIVHTQMGKGHLGFIGDVNSGPVVTQVVLAMLGL